MQLAEAVCKNCGLNFIGKYCSNCGEKLHTEKDKKVSNIVKEGFHFLTHFDGTLFTTIKTIFKFPGRLSLDYCNGIRKKYFKPLPFFLLLVIIYLLFPVFEGLNQKLYYHTHNGIYGNYALEKCLSIMNEKHLTEGELAQLFHQKGEKISKFLLFIIIPLMALFTWLLGYTKRNLYFEHFIFSSEESSFFILWGFLILPIITLLLRTAGLGFIFSTEYFILIVMMIPFLIHLFIAGKRFFNFNRYYNLFFAIAYIGMLTIVIQYLYKFLLFVIAINQI